MNLGLTPQAKYLSPLRGSPHTRSPMHSRPSPIHPTHGDNFLSGPGKLVANSKFLRPTYLFFPCAGSAPVTDARRKSLFMRAMPSIEISFGHTASHEV